MNLTWNMPVKWFLTLYVTTLSNDCEGMLWYVVHYICLFHSNLLYQHLHNYKRCHFNVMVDSQQKYLSKYENYEIYLSYCSNNKKYNVKMKTKRWKHIRNYSIIIYDENAMEIGNKDTQYNVSKKNHTTITQRYKCLLHVKFGNQPYPDYINVSYMLSLVINHTQIILPYMLFSYQTGYIMWHSRLSDKVYNVTFPA